MRRLFVGLWLTGIAACSAFSASESNPPPPAALNDGGQQPATAIDGATNNSDTGATDSAPPPPGTFCASHTAAGACIDFDDDRDAAERFFDRVEQVSGATFELATENVLSPPRSLVSRSTFPGQGRAVKVAAWKGNKIVVEADFRAVARDANGVGQAFAFVQDDLAIFLYLGTDSFLHSFRLGSSSEITKCEIAPGFVTSDWQHFKFEIETTRVLFSNGTKIVCSLPLNSVTFATSAPVEARFGLAYIDQSVMPWQYRYDNILINP